MKTFKPLLIAVFFIMLLTILWQGLFVSEQRFKPELQVPEFHLADMRSQQWIKHHQLPQQPYVLHVWASWCSICVKEHAQWMKITQRWPYPLIGVVYRDSKQAVLSILKQGDPYTYLLDDKEGKLGLELGLIGTPETYVISANKIVYHHVGAVDINLFEKELLPHLVHE